MFRAATNIVAQLVVRVKRTSNGTTLAPDGRLSPHGCAWLSLRAHRRDGIRANSCGWALRVAYGCRRSLQRIAKVAQAKAHGSFECRNLFSCPPAPSPTFVGIKGGLKMVSRGILSGMRILVVEEDDHAAIELTARLSTLGIEVVGSSPDVGEALERICSEDNIAGAILGIKSGDNGVFPVADELERRGLPFVFATSFEPYILPARHTDKIVVRKPFENASIAAALLRATEIDAITVAEAARNGILGRLSESQLAGILPRLRSVRLPQGAVMEARNRAINSLYFPIDCVASLIVVGSEGTRIEAGLIGREGMTGYGVAVGDLQNPYELISQVGGTALVLTVRDARDLLASMSSLALLSSRFALSLSVQISHTALANGRFGLKQRLARWILMIQDRAAGESFDLTHEYLAIMLGVRRPSVTDARHILEGDKLIRSKRRNVEIRSRIGLIELAGEAYGAPEIEHDRLMNLPLSSPC